MDENRDAPCSIHLISVNCPLLYPSSGFLRHFQATTLLEGETRLKVHFRGCYHAGSPLHFLRPEWKANETSPSKVFLKSKQQQIMYFVGVCRYLQMHFTARVAVVVVTGEGWDPRYWRPGISPSRQFYSNITSPHFGLGLCICIFIGKYWVAVNHASLDYLRIQFGGNINIISGLYRCVFFVWIMYVVYKIQSQ